jgi:hypothetical protein
MIIINQTHSFKKMGIKCLLLFSEKIIPKSEILNRKTSAPLARDILHV